MFSAIMYGPIWAEIAASLLGKALITGALTVIKSSPEIKKLITVATNGQSDISVEKVVDVFKDVNK